MASSKRKKWVVVKQGKFATVAGGLGSKPKVYETMKAAQFDIDSNAKLKGAVVQPHGGAEPGAAPTGAAGVTSVTSAEAPGGPVTGPLAGAANGMPTTTRAKAATKRAAKSTNPKRAAAGK